MTKCFFLDSSALLKRYVSEKGSRYVRTLHQTSDAVFYVAHIAGVEVISALTRLSLGKQISKRKAQSATAQFRNDFFTNYRIIAISELVIQRAMLLAETHALRAYDAIQLTAAVTLVQNAGGLSLTFISADERLNNVAHAEGLRVDNPNDQS